MYILFFLMWILFNGAFTLEIAAFGIVIAAAAYYFICRFMDYSIQKDLMLLRLGGSIVRYIGVLIWEIIKANVSVMHILLNMHQKPEPLLVTFDADLHTELARVVLANSITLTPGTITVALEEGSYTVHCLDKAMAQDIDTSVFVRLLQKMEQEAGVK